MNSSVPPGYWSEERTAVAKAYPGKGWLKKVAQMPSEQVHEIWMSLQKRKEKEATDGAKVQISNGTLK